MASSKPRPHAMRPNMMGLPASVVVRSMQTSIEKLDHERTIKCASTERPLALGGRSNQDPTTTALFQS